MDAVELAQSGHPGMPMGMADVATVLFTHFLKFYPEDPHFPDRDRFILSGGHGSMLLYSLLYLTGYKEVTIDQIQNFRTLHSKTPGHPEYGHTQGVEATTGPLGQGLGNGVGMALSEEILRARFGADAQDHYTYVFAGDGCLMEGICAEAISFAGHMRLSKLIVFWDNNGITIDGPTSLSTSENQILRFQAANWETIEIDGHDSIAIFNAIEAAQKSDKPVLISCKTRIGFGSPGREGKESAHGSPLGADEIVATKKALGIDYHAFQIPEKILEMWRMFGRSHTQTYHNWNKNCPDHFKNFIRVKKLNFEPLTHLTDQWMQERPALASRVSSQKVLDALIPSNPQLIGGSADLTPSNNTRVPGMMDITPNARDGNYIRYGIREHLMASCMNGIALHGGLIPYGGTFLCFTDYMRPGIRLSAIMGLKVIYVMTHDSIGLGEDGPTHQPIEHLASLRAIPGIRVYRPADALETLYSWQSALDFQGPSILVLSRQTLPFVHNDALEMQGAYVLRDAGEVTFASSGSEVHLCLEAADLMEKMHGIKARVVSIPCCELFNEEHVKLLGKKPILAVEAAAQSVFWAKHSAQFLGLDTFGASAPCKDLYEYFGLSAQNIMEKGLRLMGK
jgi:transketolase